jgi:hypothetical protein
MKQAYKNSGITDEMSLASWPGKVVRTDGQTDEEAPVTYMYRVDSVTPPHVEIAGMASIGTLLGKGFKIWVVWPGGALPNRL